MCSKWCKQDDCTFFPVVIFSGRSWCLYFDTTDGYLRFIPNGQMTVFISPFVRKG
jgi:hypothetical protein